MVDSEDFKAKVKEIIAQEYSIEFLGNNFEQIVHLLSETNAEKIYAWMKRVLQKDIQPIAVASKKQYKDWAVNELLVFRYPFTVTKIDFNDFVFLRQTMACLHISSLLVVPCIHSIFPVLGRSI